MSYDQDRVTREDRGVDVAVTNRPDGAGLAIGAVLAVLAVLFVIWLFVGNGAQPGGDDTGNTVPVETTLPVEPTVPTDGS
jgi:hypothetical protein